MHTVEFADIRIRAALPLHPYLYKHPHLFLRLVADESVCGDTAGIDGDLASGVWEFNGRLYAHRVKQSLNVAVLTGAEGPGIQVVSVTLKVAELLARVNTFPNGYQEFDIFDSGTPIQLKLVIACSIKLSSILDRVSQAVGDIDHTGNQDDRNIQAKFEPQKANLSSREGLESLYMKTNHMSDQDARKAHRLCILGYRFHTLYEKEHEKADLEKAISVHEEAMQFTGLYHAHMSQHAHCFSMALLDRFEQGGDRIDIERAISYSQTAVRFTKDVDEKRLSRFNNLGDALRLRFERFGDLTDVDNLILCLRKAIGLIPNDDPTKPRQFSQLGNALRSRFERLGNLADIDEAVSNNREAVRLAPDGHPDKPSLITNFGNALRSRFHRLGTLTDIEDAIVIQQKGIGLTPDDHPARPSRLSDLGDAFLARFERLGDLGDLDQAIANQQKAVQLAPDGHSDRPRLFENLGNAHQSRFKRLGSIEDVENAISSQQQALILTPDVHPDKSSRFINLGIALYSRFERLGNLTDVEDAISSLQKAVELMPDGHPVKPSLFTNLGNMLNSRFERLGGLADMEYGITNQRKAVELTSDGHPGKPQMLSNLSKALLGRFERLGSLKDMEDGISNLQKAVELTHDGHADKPGLFAGLGVAVLSRFERLGILVDVEDAISSLRKAVGLTPHGHPEKPSRLTQLGNALQFRFERFGSLSDIEDAISSLKEAVKLMPDGHPQKPSLLNSLSRGFHCRFERLGGLADMNDAISSLKHAVELTPLGHPSSSVLLNNFGNALRFRFRRRGSLADLEDAISTYRKAVQSSPDGHPGNSGRLSNLATSLQSRFKRLGGLADVEDAISSLQKAIELMPDGHPDKPGLFNKLGIALDYRFEHLGTVADIDRAVLIKQKAVNLTPDGHPEKSSRLYHLGSTFVIRFRHMGTPSDLERGLFAFSTAAKSTSSSAMARFLAARGWAKIAEENSRYSLEAFDCAIDLLPRIAWLGLAVTDQHALLADVGGIVRDAVAAAIRYEKYETAVVWAEQGRSIVWQNLLGLRSPVDDLHDTHPELADRLRIVAKQLEGSESHLEVPMVSSADASLNYSKLAIEWDDIVEEVRRIPGFEDFLKAKSFRQLAPAAHEGPVVILNVSDVQCDALVLIADGSNDKQVTVVNIPLKRFSDETSKNLFHSLTSLLTGAGVRVRHPRLLKHRSPPDGESKFKDILRILWQDIVKPVLEGLAFQIESRRPPRIWWCVNGSLAFLPIHAAGLYDTPDIGERISDYVISSYTPTLNAILELSDPVAHEDFQVLTVAQASAPGAQSIPDTEGEVRIVQRFTDGARRVNLMREDATVKRVREEMTESNWIHLACHGQQDPDNPMESGFLLHDRILKLSEIVKISLPKADLAFLSACQTAMGDEKVAEESVHLAAGMLLSGCRGVIATTWSIRDEDGPTIAEEVYSRIFKDGKPDRKEAAYALHEAVKLLRESGAPCTSWVPFIHIGR